ncbi:unnamed protein product, partial [Prorocentrum cordatum]
GLAQGRWAGAKSPSRGAGAWRGRALAHSAAELGATVSARGGARWRDVERRGDLVHQGEGAGARRHPAVHRIGAGQGRRVRRQAGRGLERADRAGPDPEAAGELSSIFKYHRQHQRDGEEGRGPPHELRGLLGRGNGRCPQLPLGEQGARLRGAGIRRRRLRAPRGPPVVQGLGPPPHLADHHDGEARGQGVPRFLAFCRPPEPLFPPDSLAPPLPPPPPLV